MSEYPQIELPDGRWATVIPLTFGRARKRPMRMDELIAAAEAAYDERVERQKQKDRRAGRASHDGTMSDYGLDLARRGAARPDQPAAESRDPWACPRCGGPTSAQGRPCEEC